MLFWVGVYIFGQVISMKTTLTEKHTAKRSCIVLFWVWFLCVLFIPKALLAATHIQAESLKSLKITVNRSIPAEVISLREATVASQLSTTVTELPLLVGDYVVEQQPIARLDCQDNQLVLQQNRSELAALSANRVLASQQLERLEKLRKSNNASEEEINQKQAELNVVKARINAQNIAIKIAARQVDKCEIKAPFDGIVTEVHSASGNFVTPGSAVATVVDTKNIELSARINTTELTETENNNLYFLYQDRTYPVQIRTVLNIVNSQTQNQYMRLRFIENNPLPGSNGRLQWTLPGTTLPASLVVNRNGESGIFIVENTSDIPVARFVAIPGAKPGQPVLVDLNEDTLIVTDGRFALADGEPVSL